MYKWFSLLSTRQRSEMVSIVLIMAIILGVGVVMNLPKEKTISEIFTTDMSIRDIAPKLEVTGKGLARELGLSLDTPKKKTTQQIGDISGTTGSCGCTYPFPSLDKPKILRVCSNRAVWFGVSNSLRSPG